MNLRTTTIDNRADFYFSLGVLLFLAVAFVAA